MSNKIKLPAVLEDFITATNHNNSDAFMACFAEDALINDVARNFCGKEQIKKWSDKEMIGDRITMKPDVIVEHYGDYLITVLTDGNYDKNLVPDPLYLDYFFTIKNNQIVKMIVILNKEKSFKKS